MTVRLLIALLALVAAGAVLAGCGQGQGVLQRAAPSSWNASRGRLLIGYYGCGACHVIGGIATATGRVGPPLTRFTQRYHELAGVLPNTPQNVVRWIMDPPRFVPKGDMPVLGVGRHGAEDIAAYLYGQ